MKTYEEISEYLETPEGKEKVNEFARMYIDKINELDKKKKRYCF